MIVTPVGRLVKTASPDAPARRAGGGLLLPVEAGGNSQPFAYHECAKVSTADRAAREEPVVSVLVFGAAIDSSTGQKRRHAITGGTTAGPTGAVGGRAILCKFGRVDAEQTNPVVAQPEAVAVAGASVASHRWRRGIEPGGDQCEPRQNDDGQYCAPAARKDDVSVRISTQDFTAR